jgi:hypothetical protein
MFWVLTGIFHNISVMILVSDINSKMGIGGAKKFVKMGKLCSFPHDVIHSDK